MSGLSSGGGRASKSGNFDVGECSSGWDRLGDRGGSVDPSELA